MPTMKEMQNDPNGQWDDTGMFHPFEKGTNFGPAVDEGTKQRYAAWEAQQRAQGAGLEENQGITGGFFDNANKFVLDHLVNLNNVGTASYEKPRIAESMRSRMDMFANGVKADDNDLPVGPGKTYLTHLFKHHNMKDKLQKHFEKENPKNNIYTDQQEALRTALQLIGCYSDRNQGGMPIDIHDAKKLWFGDKEVSPHEEAEFRSTVEVGDNKLDPKKVRRFVNHDGSLTWEVLNDDKTVMSRFTMGEYNGKKIFAQGGYKSFAELLKKAKGKFGEDFGAQFDAIRGMGA